MEATKYNNKLRVGRLLPIDMDYLPSVDAWGHEGEDLWWWP